MTQTKADRIAALYADILDEAPSAIDYWGAIDRADGVVLDLHGEHPGQQMPYTQESVLQAMGRIALNGLASPMITADVRNSLIRFDSSYLDSDDVDAIIQVTVFDAILYG